MKLMIPTPVPLIHRNDNDEFLDQDNSEIAVKSLLMIKWYVRVKILRIAIILLGLLLLETNEIRNSDF